jgi:hypothetical protein
MRRSEAFLQHASSLPQAACTLQVLLEPSSKAKQHVAQLVAQLSQDQTDLTLSESAMALSGYCSVSSLHCEHVFAAGAVPKLLQLVEHAGSPQVGHTINQSKLLHSLDLGKTPNAWVNSSAACK